MAFNQGLSKSGSGSESGSGGGGKTGMGIDLGNAHALLIGVGTYEYGKWSIPVAARDAEALAEVLGTPEHCNYPREQIHRLTHAEATRENILAALDHLAEVSRTPGESTILVYFSGHGWVHEGRYYLLPHETAPLDVASTALPAERFKEALRAIDAQRLLVMLDTCHAEGMAESKDSSAVTVIPAGYEPRALDPQEAEALIENDRGRVVLLSCQGDQKSWIEPGRDLSIFTEHLIAALRGEGARDGERFVTVSDLMGYVSREVKRSAARIQREQTPFYDIKASDFVVARVPDLPATPEASAQPGNTVVHNTAGRDMYQGVGTITVNNRD